MLKGLDPLLGPELLATLRAMGHAAEVAVVDANCPAAANARRLIRACLPHFCKTRAVGSKICIERREPGNEIAGEIGDQPGLRHTEEYPRAFAMALGKSGLDKKS